MNSAFGYLTVAPYFFVYIHLLNLLLYLPYTNKRLLSVCLGTHLGPTLNLTPRSCSRLELD